MNKPHVYLMQGGALLLPLIVTATLASLTLLWMLQQLLNQHDSLQQQRRWVNEQQSMDDLFNQQAALIIRTQNDSVELVTESDTYWFFLAEELCQPVTVTSRCWRVRLGRYTDTLWQERVLRIPDGECGEPYWMAHLARRGYE